MADDEKELERMYGKCVSGLADFVNDAHFSDVVLGLSGGIDSSLVAVMAVDALGASRVHAVMLPGPYSSASSITDAQELAENLGIDCMQIPITQAYDAFSSTFEDCAGIPLAGLASENTQARLRMVCIMALSNEFGWMMLNTGNKTEACMGYSTLYGDTAGAYAPIGGVYKTDVFALSKWRNHKALSDGDAPPIPENVITKPPSAELSPDQTDEASLGIEYSELDPILKAHVEEGMDASQISSLGLDHVLVEDVLSRYDSYAFKRAMEPPFPDVYGSGEIYGC